MISRTTITEDELESRATGGEGLHILIVSSEMFGAIPLPERGSIMIGRSAKAEVLIEDPLASRQHARLTVGDSLTIEDLDQSLTLRNSLHEEIDHRSRRWILPS